MSGLEAQRVRWRRPALAWQAVLGSARTAPLALRYSGSDLQAVDRSMINRMLTPLATVAHLNQRLYLLVIIAIARPLLSRLSSHVQELTQIK